MHRPTLGRIVMCTLDKAIAEQISKAGGARHYAPGEQVPGIVCGTQNNNSVNLYLFPDGGGGPTYVAGVQFAETGAPRTWNWPERVDEEAAA